MNKTLSMAALLTAAALGFAGSAAAQVAGSTTTLDVSVTEATQVALGWSVKKTLLGKTVYNDAGQKIGKVEDLIVAPDRNLSYVIVGTGGFVGIGRHDVAVPISQLQDKGGRLVMPGATQDVLKAMPAFEYANDGARRSAFIASADRDIAKARAAVAGLEKKANDASGDARARIEQQIATVQADLKVADAKLGELKHAAANRWKEFEGDVNAATAKLRKSIDTAAA